MTAVPLPRLRSRDLVSVGTVGLRSRPARTLLTALGVAIGVAAVVAVLGISASSRADLLATLDELGTNLLVATPGNDFFGEQSTLPDAAAAMIRRIGPVERASATTQVDATVRRNDHVPETQTNGLSLVAVEPSLLETLEAVDLAHGRFLEERDGSFPVIVLGSTTARRLGINDLDGLPRVWLDGEWYAVVGILEPFALAPQLDAAALISYPAAERSFGTETSASAIFLRADPEDVNAVAQVLPRTANPEAPDEVDITRPSDALEARAAVDSALTNLLLGLGAVALAVGGVGIANVMVIAVLERSSEIGVRRALGASRAHIRRQFVVESALLALLGGLAGLALGAGVTAAYAARRGWTLDVPPTALLVGVGAALALGALAGLWPASRAARLDPAEAVRATG